MTQRTEQAAERVSSVLARWDEVTAVGLTTLGEDVYDPYLSLSFDVYVRRDIREAGEREGAFGDVAAFESSILTSKDRFLIGQMPIRLEYKHTGRYDDLVGAALRGECALRDAGTYAFRRVVDAKVLVSHDEWFESVRSSLTKLPDGFWGRLRHAQQATVEHLYADLSAAAMRNDAFYFVATAGSFLTQVCALLLTVNRRFEPSPRALHGEVLSLPTIPDSFRANLDNFVDQEHQLSMSQRRELAELMVTSVLSL